MLRASKLLKSGFSIKVINEKLIVSPKEKLTKETRLYIKEFKSEIINELMPLSLNAVSKVWLAKTAYILNVPSDFLLGYGFIDEFDLKDLIHVNPLIVANSIKSNPQWTVTTKPVNEIEQVAVIDDRADQTEQVKDNPYFNQFIDHLTHSKGACCYAPANRYCGMGRELKASYEDSCNAT